MRIEVVAVGTELLLGQIADTNSMWLGEQMAAAGVDSHFHQAVGDNHLEPAFWLLLTKDRFDTILYVPGFV